MKKLVWLGLPLMVFTAALSLGAQTQTPSPQQTITLYAPDYPGDLYRVSVDLDRVAYAPRMRFGDLGYGLLRAGNEWDWFEVSIAQDRRTVIQDIGPHAWTDKIAVPWVEPLAKLKPGERREVFVNTSGADGKGAPKAGTYEGLSPLPTGGVSTSPDACCDTPFSTGPVERATIRESSREKPRPAGIQTSSNMLKAILGHMYVLHVVDDKRDFYTLFRVESLERGRNCTISWKMIPPPPQPTTVKK